MLIAKVIGNVWATRKEENMKGQKLLVVKQVDENKNPVGNAFVAVDNIGAGIGEYVIVTTGSSARKVSDEIIPIDAAVIGIVDSMEIE
ncbi:EutN/CcmL family microcompartment protein [Thermovenabulum gondwanense]|uniref:Ethanolamine utilization protein EutN n=1 Tax=Thermovenabulum gondwanense TaxID=520767 RepID=A0A162M5Y3_9FIRM|nr:EutN/CcmL family microcompartment protein [Thermovenabulum gondwanense]KYO64147.1 Ethanolamine utilization protein EutN [Thermovenabulum gondwanense]